MASNKMKVEYTLTPMQLLEAEIDNLSPPVLHQRIKLTVDGRNWYFITFGALTSPQSINSYTNTVNAIKKYFPDARPWPQCPQNVHDAFIGRIGSECNVEKGNLGSAYLLYPID